MERRVELAIRKGDVLSFDADVLALKFADGLYGADAAVSRSLGFTPDDIKTRVLQTSDFGLVPSYGRLSAKQVLYIRVGNLYSFAYAEIRSFAAEVLNVLAREAPLTGHLAMTIHGVGYGLDEGETLRSQLAGILDALREGEYPATLRRITIVERNPDRVQRLRAVLDSAIPEGSVRLPKVGQPTVQTKAVDGPRWASDVGRESAKKPHVFVAMPFSEEMEDIYYYGIRTPVNVAGYLCERADLSAFTGDILDRIKVRIETASLVIADLTTANPNVYLEVGYAWGRERPTILLVSRTEELKFDVRGQRCLVYNGIRHLEKTLAQELEGLVADYPGTHLDSRAMNEPSLPGLAAL